MQRLGIVHSSTAPDPVHHIRKNESKFPFLPSDRRMYTIQIVQFYTIVVARQP